MSDLDDFKATYFDECSELLLDLEEQFAAIEAGDRSPERLNAVFRAIHSIKGGAGFLGLTKVNDLAHAAENVLNKIRMRELTPTTEIVDLLLRSADLLRTLIEAIGGNRQDKHDSYDIRPFVREARPLVRDLRPASVRLANAAPGLTRTFKQLNNFFNLLAWNPNGREGPENADRQEGYLFWVAWAQHMAIQLFSTADANGVFRPVTIAAPCATIEQTIKDQPEIEFLSMLTPILTESKACATK